MTSSTGPPNTVHHASDFRADRRRAIGLGHSGREAALRPPDGEPGRMEEQRGPEIGIGLALTAYKRLTLHEGLVAAFGGA